MGAERHTKEIIAKLNTAVIEALRDPVVQKRFVHLGQEIPGRDQMTPEALATSHKSELITMVANHAGGRDKGELMRFTSWLLPFG